MKYQATTVEQYLEAIPADRKPVFMQLYKIIQDNLPSGFEETITYGMIGWVVPHTLYPAGYHVDPRLPLPFVSIACQKHHIAVYHSGMYSDPELLEWYVERYREIYGRQPDMGKSCLRFKHAEKIPFELIAELMRKLTPQEWIELYERQIKSRKKSR